MKYECHGHIISDGCSYKDSAARHRNGIDESSLRRSLSTCAEHSIRFYRDGGDKYMVSAHAKKIAGEYGIDYRTPVFMIFKEGYYGKMFGRPYETLSDFIGLVREIESHGADFIKIAVSGILDFNKNGEVQGPSLTFEELKELVNIACGEGLSIMAHVNGADNIKNTLSAGVGSVEHGFWPDLDVIDYFLQTGAVWVPTVTPIKNLIGTGRYSDSVLQDIIDRQKEILLEAYKRGVLIASGSDCGAFMVQQGIGTDNEYSILGQLGINPEKGNLVIADRFKR